jgi:hypothetical protein
LYEDSRISSNHQTIDPEIKILKRRELAGSTLGVCFEKSASSRQLENQLGKSQSPLELRQRKQKRRLQSAQSSVMGKKKKVKREKRPSSSSGKQKLISLPGPGRITV